LTYQVLARKWRPQRFGDMVGQRHVLRALINALEQDRLHHAYLFTGTRGVGKTTIARLFAKALNCEAGVSSEPCGVCGSCVEIAENRFVDLIEVDAASRTRVEDTRELLDNVQYAPTRGRYKVYLIDEVHMLSSHSFNALLKTLEEPPPHVKFLLATTDPQKLPVTVLSRCLQFNLKQMTPQLIADYLAQVLTAEQVTFEASALELLGRAAQGSMRDALSLTDQAIAYGQGQLLESEVAAMLGTVDRRQVMSLVRSLLQQDAPTLLQQMHDIAEFAPDWQALMSEILAILHRLTVLQLAPDYQPPFNAEVLQDLAHQCPPEDVQLYYQLGLQAFHDLGLAPDPQQGFEMALLRMLAFTPEPPPPGHLRFAETPAQNSMQPATEPANDSTSSQSARAESTPAADQPPQNPPFKPSLGLPEAAASIAEVSFDASDLDGLPAAANEAQLIPEFTADPEAETSSVQLEVGVETAVLAQFPPATQRALDQMHANMDDLPTLWLDLIPAFEVSGVLENLLRHTVVASLDDEQIVLRTDPSYEAIFDARYEQVLLDAMHQLDMPIRQVQFEFADSDHETLHQRDLRQRKEALTHARHALEQDHLVQLLQQSFQANILVETIVPHGPQTTPEIESIKRQAS